jgi:hypothetical protein
MAENKIYMALGEEALRGTKEATSVGYVPMLSPSIPKMEFNDKKRSEFRGEDTVKGDTTVLRMDRKWSASVEMPFFTESGSSKGLVGTLLKHFFGTVSSNQKGATTAYAHMMYPVADPFSSSNLSTKALTLNLNINEGSTMKNWPFVGGRVSSLSFEQEPGGHLSVSAELFGQKKDTVTSEIGSPVFAAENLRCDFTNLSVYTGTVSRTGTAPNYTDFDCSGATQIKPDKISIKIENGMADSLRLDGNDYPTKTRMGRYKLTLDMTIDWEDPASGFSSIDEFTSWVASAAATNFCLVWDTDTEAGTGYNHKLVIDIPVAERMGGEPEYDLEKDPMITLSYEALFDEDTTKYIVGCLMQNSATTI